MKLRIRRYKEIQREEEKANKQGRKRAKELEKKRNGLKKR